MERNKLYFIDSIDNYGITEGADHVSTYFARQVA